MRKFLLFSAFILAAQSTPAIGQWESAHNVDQEPTGDPLLIRCIYETIGGYRFAMIARGICPFVIQVNPETGQVRR